MFAIRILLVAADMTQQINEEVPRLKKINESQCPDNRSTDLPDQTTISIDQDILVGAL